MNFGSLEKIETVILRPSSNFRIKNVVTFGSRNEIGGRKDAFYENSYKSNKYNNLDYVSSNTLETQDYLVFEYNEYDAETKKRKKEEIFISYPHIYELKNLIESVYTEYLEGQVFKTNDEGILYISNEYEDYFEKIKLINNKNIGLLFDVLENYDENLQTVSYEEGITFVFNDEDYRTTISMDSFYYIYRFVNEFNLLQSSQNLILLSFMNEIANGLNLTNKTVSESKSGKINGRKIKSRKEIKENKKKELDERQKAFFPDENDPREEIPFN